MLAVFVHWEVRNAGVCRARTIMSVKTKACEEDRQNTFLKSLGTLHG